MRRFALAAFVLLATPAKAQDCKLVMVGSLDFTTGSSDARVLVDADLGAVKGKMIVDTGAFSTMVAQDAADKLKIHRLVINGNANMTTPQDLFGWIGVLPSLTIGTFHGSDVHALISQDWHDKDAVGVIGADFLSQFDVEFDFARHRMNLFSHDHCTGQVVYWTHDPAAVLPVKINGNGNITTTVVLDGREIDALVDTGAAYSMMTLAGARKMFGLTAASPGVAPYAGWPGFLTYAFKTLQLGDVAFGHPTVVFRDGHRPYDVAGSEGEQDRLLLLGLHDLRKLRLFISYREHMLYATPAEAH